MSTPKDKPRCCKEVRDDASSRWPRYNQCTRAGTIEREGKLYCKQHDPVEREKKAEASYSAWKAKMEGAIKEKQRARVCALACHGLSDPALAIQRAREELAHLIRCVDLFLESGNSITGLATMNGAKFALNLLTPTK